MIVLLIGATESATAVVRDVAKTLSVDLRVGASQGRPDWVVTATESERRDALRRYALPSYRVVELQELGANGMVHDDRLGVALSRMLEIGPIPRSTPRLAGQLATRALPLLREWATWLAADEARQKIAAHASFLRSKSGPPPKARVMFVVPDARALAVLRGLLHRLSHERHEVYVAIADVRPGDPALTAFDGYWGLTVGQAPALHARSGRFRSWLERRRPPELDVISLLEDRKPNVIVVVPHRTSPAAEPDYFRASRWLGIHSVCLPLQWDDLEASRGLRHEPPDFFAVWNEEQRREAVSSFNLPVERIQITGALLPSDIVEGHAPLERDAYCARMGIDPSRRIILTDAPTVSSPAWIARFQEWRQAVKASANPEVHHAAVIVYVENQDEVATWRRLASTADIAVARAGTDADRVAFRLAESLAAADVVVATGLTLALEAMAGRKPVVVLPGTEDDNAGDLARFIRAYPPGREPFLVSRSIPDTVAQILMTLTQGIPADTLQQAAAILRPSGNHTGAAQVYRLLDDVAHQEYTFQAPVRPPFWQRLFVLLCAAPARRRVAAK